MARTQYELKTVAYQIHDSGKSIYDALGAGDSRLWLSTAELEQVLNDTLCGMNLGGLPLRTRSKALKEAVCKALGYPVPSSFKKTKPRFPGQDFDTYIQKSDNLQVWNEELDATRRYVIIRVSDRDVIVRVKVVDGATLARLDRTGTLTQKYQARFVASNQSHELITPWDTDLLRSALGDRIPSTGLPGSPTDVPTSISLIPIAEVFRRLSPLVGECFTNAGHDQERTRGANLHRRVSQALGYEHYRDDGSFPDVKGQLLEVKLQTSPTIDLGLVTPSSTGFLDLPAIAGQFLRHCDVRYAVFYADTDSSEVRLTHLVLVTGEAFFSRFTRFEGRVLNKKLQIPLPREFFDS